MNEKPKVAVIEDDPDIADIVRFALENEGCEVRVARDGVVGLALVRGWGPDLVLLDIAMPGMDGFQVLHEIRRNTRIRQMPVIMMTARKQGADVQQALSAGADDYLVKPFELSALVAKVRRRLAGRATPADPAARPPSGTVRI